MGSRFIFVIFFLTTALILAVWLRSANNRIFHDLRRCETERKQLEQQLWQKQLRLESLINPATISERLGRS